MTGAVRILASEYAYPLRITVRPTAQGGETASQDGTRNFGHMVPGAGHLVARASGHNVDFWIRNADEFDDHISPRFVKTRHRAAVAEVHQSTAPSTPESDIYDRTFCGKCHKEIEGGALCAACAGSIENIDRCTAPRETPDGFFECHGVRLPGLKMCRQHAEERGLVPKPDESTLCNWRGCGETRPQWAPFCQQHATMFGAFIGVGASAPPPTLQPQPVEVAPSPKSTGRGGARVHKPDCMCPAHKKRTLARQVEAETATTPPNLVAAGQAEVESVDEVVPVTTTTETS